MVGKGLTSKNTRQKAMDGKVSSRKWWFKKKTTEVDTLPAETAVKTLPSKAVGVGLTPGGGAKIPHAS